MYDQSTGCNIRATDDQGWRREKGEFAWISVSGGVLFQKRIGLDVQRCRVNVLFHTVRCCGRTFPDPGIPTRMRTRVLRAWLGWLDLGMGGCEDFELSVSVLLSMVSMDHVRLVYDLRLQVGMFWVVRWDGVAVTK